MSDLILRVFEADDTTAAWEVGTSAAHPNPYLHVPVAYAEAEIDPREGRSRIGRLSVRIADPQVGADQTQRWVTQVLGSPDGYSALNGRRVRLEHATGELVIDGVCAGSRLTETFAGFELAIDDIRARGIRVPLFTRTGTATVLPRGVLNGYGQVPGGSWLVPPTKPLLGTYSGDALHGWVGLDDAPQSATDEVPPDLVYTPAMQRAMRSTTRFDDWVFESVWEQVTVLWRPEGSLSDWTEVKRINVVLALAPIFGSGRVRNAEDDLVDVLVVRRIWLSDYGESGVLPATGQRIELVVRYSGPASEDYPFHFEGTAGELLRNIWRGDYSTDDDGQPIAPGIRYDESRLVGPAALPALQRPVRLRITKPEPDLREFVDRICKALGVAPALNLEGEVSPISEELPDATVSLPEINDSNTQAITGWEHPITGAVTQVEISYPRDYRVSARSDPKGDRSAGDGISTVEQKVTVRPPDDGALQQLMGVQTLEVDGFLWRALAGEDGQPLVASIRDEAGLQHAQSRGVEAILRYAYGGQRSVVRVRRNDSPMNGIVVGDWVLDARSWAPNYATGRRGRNHLAQVVSVRDLNPAWRELHLLDAAPHANPVAQPVLGDLSEDSPGVVTAPISAVPTGGFVRVDYAVSPTLPDNDSGLWTLAGRLTESGSVFTPQLPPGVTVWIRARGERAGRRPSAYTNAKSLTLAAAAEVIRAFLSVDDDGIARVSAEVNELTEGVRIHYAVHAPGAYPTSFPNSADFAAPADSFVLPVVVGAGMEITVEVEPWTGWTGAAVTGFSGLRARRSRERGSTLPVTTHSWAYQGGGRVLRLSVDPGNATIRYRLGGSGAWQAAAGPSVDVAIDLSGGSKIIEFYGELPGGVREQTHVLQLDEDADPEFDALTLEETSPNRITARLALMDDDVVRWQLWARVGSLPFLEGDDGQPTGEPNPRYLRDDGAATRQPRPWHAIDGTWHAIARAYDARGRYMQRTAQITIAGSPPAQAELSALAVQLVGGHHRLTWSHNAAVGSGHRVVARETSGGHTRDVLTLGAARPPTWEPGETADTTPGSGGYDVPVQIGSTFRRFDYEVLLYDGGTYLRSYTLSIQGANYAADPVSGKPTISPSNLVLVQLGSMLSANWVNNSDTLQIEVEYQVMLALDIKWDRLATVLRSQGTITDDETVAAGLGGNVSAGDRVRFYARYVNSAGAGPWSSASEIVVVS